MNHAMPTTKPAKTQYSEEEAAEELGVSVEKLRTLIRSHIAETDEDLTHIAAASFHPSDLLVLKLLVASTATPIPQG